MTAPIAAWAISTFAPKLLERGEVDPTKVTVATRHLLLAAVDTSPLATQVLLKAADFARRSDSEVIVLYVVNVSHPQAVGQLHQHTQRLLSDIRYRFITVTGSVPEQIIRTAQEYQVADIIMGSGHQPWEQVLVGSVSQAVLESSPVPVILVEDRQVIQRLLNRNNHRPRRGNDSVFANRSGNG